MKKGGWRVNSKATIDTVNGDKLQNKECMGSCEVTWSYIFLGTRGSLRSRIVVVIGGWASVFSFIFLLSFFVYHSSDFFPLLHSTPENPSSAKKPPSSKEIITKPDRRTNFFFEMMPQVSLAPPGVDRSDLFDK